MRELPSDDARELYRADPHGQGLVSQARRSTLRELIAMRHQIDKLIHELSGDPEHRDFVKRELDGESPTARKLRYYDVGLMSPEEIAEKYGLPVDDETGDIPCWFRERMERLSISTPAS